MMYSESVFIKFLLEGATSPGEMAIRLREEAERFEEMDRAGVVLQQEVDNGWAHFETGDPDVARRFHFRGDDDDVPMGTKASEIGSMRSIT
jgi:hypothetical protein